MYVDKMLTGLQCRADPVAPQPHPPAEGRTPSSSTSATTPRTSEGVRAVLRPDRCTATDPNLLYDTRRRLDEYDVLRPEEIEATVAVLLTIATQGPREYLRAPRPRCRAIQGPRRGGPAGLQGCPRQVRAHLRFLVPGGSSATPNWSGTTSTAGRWHRDSGQNTVERLDLGNGSGADPSAKRGHLRRAPCRSTPTPVK